MCVCVMCVRVHARVCMRLCLCLCLCLYSHSCVGALCNSERCLTLQLDCHVCATCSDEEHYVVMLFVYTCHNISGALIQESHMA